MAPWLGVSRLNLANRPGGKRVEEAKIFPAVPLLSESDWNKIKGYYEDSAPGAPLLATNKPAPAANLSLFRKKRLIATRAAPFTSMVKIHPPTRTLYVGDGQEKSLRAIHGDHSSMLPVDSAPVSLTFGKTNFTLTLIGRMLPSDELAGQVWSQSFDLAVQPQKLIRGLPRLSHTTVADLNVDGLDDLALCGYGYTLGGLIVATRMQDGSFKKVEIAPGPGFIATHVADFDRDGQPDIIALRGQGREGVEIYYNRGSAGFQVESTLRFPPTYGTAAWQVLDFDRDGHLDLLIANGDSGDYPSKPKAYHGIRLYKGHGHGRFSEVWTFPMHGAYGVAAADFDLDGDLDIAAISFFPDYKNYPEESFLYFENVSRLTFKPHTLEQSREGRWIVIDAGDLDGDGDADIALGSYVHGPTTTWIPESLKAGWEANRVSVLVLENQTR